MYIYSTEEMQGPLKSVTLRQMAGAITLALLSVICALAVLAFFGFTL